MRRLRQQVQAQGLAAAARQVRVPQAAQLPVPLLRVPRLPEAQPAAARAPPAQGPARARGRGGRVTRTSEVQPAAAAAWN